MEQTHRQSASDRKSSPAPRLDFFILILLLAVSIALWHTVLLFPVKLFVVLLHELSHGAAAVLTGGSIVRIEIDARIGGACLTQGGMPLLVVSSGYVGSMALGGAILLGALRRRAAVALGYAIAAIVLLVTVGFVHNTFGRIFGIAFGAGLAAAMRFLPARAASIAVQYLGAASCMYALIDVKEDLLTLAPRPTDAAILAEMSGVPAIVWGLLWAGLSLALFLFIMRSAWKNRSAPL